MESISIFDIFKIGVGPSSSHTMGPWRAAQRFLETCQIGDCLERIVRLRVELFGSLAKTGRGHGTDVAIILALLGEDPETCNTENLESRARDRASSGSISLLAQRTIDFDLDADIMFHRDRTLPQHANGLRFTALLSDGRRIERTYFSVGGGFVVEDGDTLPTGARALRLPYPIDRPEQLARYCADLKWSIPRVVHANELCWRDDAFIRSGILRIWREMQHCIFRGCHADGTLPGGLNVVRRASGIARSLLHGVGHSGHLEYEDVDGWVDLVRHSTRDFSVVLKWVSTFALAVNEENAAFGRVVTAPTNGAAGVIPAVLMYYWCFCRSSERGIIDFLLTAGEIGSLFKKGATISAAMGGCQAEIGVSSAMAAAGLAQVLGASPGQALMAAEIAMEHHLGMTCDPIGGLVQIPCIERNTMGAIKAITAASIAIESNPAHARVSLDSVIKTMWETAQDMQSKYKETSEGGLAVNVSISEC